jgi:SAM-dependent methyltransferase
LGGVGQKYNDKSKTIRLFLPDYFFMSKVYTTEITSELIPSDNPIHQRLLKAYVIAEGLVKGDVLEVGCGEGRGIDRIIPRVKTFTAIDKIEPVIEDLRRKYPTGKFLSGNIPPLSTFTSDSFDVVLSFQVIEHIQDDKLFLQEIHRVLRPGGTAYITTPNRPLSLTRNPWHIREYTGTELAALARNIFANVEMKGVGGNERIMEYYRRNKKSVERVARLDIFDLQHRLPASLLKIPYELLNRWNRNKLKDASDELVRSIRHEDYLFVDSADSALDLFLIARK